MKRHTITCPHHDLTITPEGTTCDSCGEGIDLAPTCADCIRNRATGYGPSHNGSPRCRMRTSIAAGGNCSHCTCNACF
ncbi:MAG: hypothetical protein ACYS7Y_30495 [Planctomycetota bacterium]|jgi:hypothetical protein